MNIKTTLLLVAALGFASPLLAAGDSIEEVAHQSGLSVQQVRMLIGGIRPAEPILPHVADGCEADGFIGIGVLLWPAPSVLWSGSCASALLRAVG